MPTERVLHLNDEEIESLLDPWRETRALDLDDPSYSALKKLQQAQGGGLDEELAEPRHAPIPRLAIGDSASEWFVKRMFEQEPLPVPPGTPFQAVVVQHAQSAMSRLNEAVRHAGDTSAERVIEHAALVGLFAMTIARAVQEADEWPIPRTD